MLPMLLFVMVSLFDGTIFFVFLLVLQTFSLPLEHFIISVFLPSLLGRTVPGDVERKLFALSV